MKYKLTVAYDGTHFFGWQLQPKLPSIAFAMQKSFASAFKHEIKLEGASRTDAGVHALGQVASFATDLQLDADKIMRVWNDALPPTIKIQDLCIVDDDFHPRYNVQEKTYWYHFSLQRPLPSVQAYSWYVRHKIDLNLLQDALNLFVGTHDFRSFCTGAEDDQTTVRTINSIALSKEQFDIYRITVKGPGFLRHMIRRIVGASFDVAAGRVTIDDLKRIVEERDPKQTLLNAPAQGLCLYAIAYKKDVIS